MLWESNGSNWCTYLYPNSIRPESLSQVGEAEYTNLGQIYTQTLGRGVKGDVGGSWRHALHWIVL